MIAAQPGAVINAAAYSDVDRAESEEPVRRSQRRGADATCAETGAAGYRSSNLDRLCVRRAQGLLMSKKTRWRPQCLWSSKLAGEFGAKPLIAAYHLRTSGSTAPYARIFQTICASAGSRPSDVVSDQRGCRARRLTSPGPSSISPCAVQRSRSGRPRCLPFCRAATQLGLICQRHY